MKIFMFCLISFFSDFHFQALLILIICPLSYWKLICSFDLTDSTKTDFLKH